MAAIGTDGLRERIQDGIEDLSKLTDDAFVGWGRVVFSEPYRVARDWVRRRMVEAGLETRIDASGNIVGRLQGEGAAKPIVTGSHTDTVVGGGRFDGVVGVLAAIEVARLVRESGQRLHHDLLVVDFLGEEANEFGVSCIGSRSVAGLLAADQLERRDLAGRRLGDVMESFGLDVGGSLSSAWGRGSLHAFVELHVEQGPLLERQHKSIGVVTAIAGIERLTAVFAGRADHAGTMPMTERLDALTAAAEAIVTIEREGCGAPVHAVTTTGRIESTPGSFNVIPERAQIWAELRSIESSWLTGARRRLAEQLAADAAARGVGVDLEWLSDQDPVPTDQSIQGAIGRAADMHGLAWTAVPSGAGHDAAHMAHMGPMGMIFVPSAGGRSHCPQEWTELADIASGVEVLLSTITDLDATSTVARV